MKTNIEEIAKQIAEAREKIDISEREFPFLSGLFNTLPGKVFFAYYYPENAKIIAHVDTRAAFAPVRALHRGVWDKLAEVDEGMNCLRYSATLESGVEINCKVRELPPSCRIVEETVDVPAMAAHTEVRRSIKCDADTKAEAREATT